MLMRSVGSLAMQTPHTGALNYSEADPKIPAAAITLEDATLIQRLTDTGETVSVHLYMEAHMLPDADSANVMGEIPGREKPEEIVVMGGHIDSWDVGAGAQDDGSGIMAALEAAAVIRKLGLHPRRTLRVVFWTNEENGGAGGRAYRAMVGGKIHDYVAAIEMDGGAEKPLGFGVTPGGAVLARAKEIGRLLAPVGADIVREGGGGADIAPAHARWRPRPRPVDRRAALFRLASHPHRYRGQNQPAGIPAVRRRHGGDELRAGGYAGPAGRVDCRAGVHAGCPRPGRPRPASSTW